MAFKLDLSAIERESRVPLVTKARVIVAAYFAEIAAGKVISQPYALSTKARRIKHGLPVDRVRLYGNNKYSAKSWRLLNAAKVKISVKHYKFSVDWVSPTYGKLWSHHTRRYSEL